MSSGFLGVSKHTLENGNRLIIPARFREQLSPEFVLFKSVDGCLSIYDRESFDEILSQTRLLTNTPEGRMKARTVTRAAKYLQPDKQGRFTIPADYISFASLGDTVYLTGEGNRLEIWNEEAYLEQEKELSADMYPELFY